MLTDVEIARLPEAQAFLTEWNEAEKVVQETEVGVKPLQQRLKKIKEEIQEIRNRYRGFPIQILLIKLTNESYDIRDREEMQAYQNALTRVRRYRKVMSTRSDPETALVTVIKASKGFVMPCPQQDCRGFLSSQYRCGVCEHDIALAPLHSDDSTQSYQY